MISRQRLSWPIEKLSHETCVTYHFQSWCRAHCSTCHCAHRLRLSSVVCAIARLQYWLLSHSLGCCLCDNIPNIAATFWSVGRGFCIKTLRPLACWSTYALRLDGTDSLRTGTDKKARNPCQLLRNFALIYKFIVTPKI